MRITVNVPVARVARPVRSFTTARPGRVDGWFPPPIEDELVPRMLPAFAVCLVVPGLLSAADWPAFRGPTGQGVSVEKDLPTEWGPGRNVKWSTPLPGPANSSPIVVRGRVLLTTAEDKGARRTLHCFDRAKGELLWSRTVEAAAGIETHDTNPYSGSTPVSDGERVVVWHGTPGLFCYDLEGKELWSASLGPVKHIWGYGSSPVLVGDRVLLNFGPGENTALLAVSLKDGNVLWRNEEPGGAVDRNQGGGYVGSWSTPVVTELDGRTVAITSMPTRVVAVDPADGTELWSVDGLKHDGANHELAYTSVVLGDGVGIAMGGFKGPAFGFQLGKVEDGERRLWRTGRGNPQRIGSGIVVDGLLYQANAGPGIVECIDPRTGDVKWRERLQGGVAWGSLVLGGGHLYVTCQDGTTNVFRPNSEKYDPVATNSLKGKCNSTPALSDGEIFVRTYDALYCIAD